MSGGLCFFTKTDHLFAFLAGVRSKFNSIIHKYETHTLFCPNWDKDPTKNTIVRTVKHTTCTVCTAKSIANNFCANVFPFCACLTIKVIILFYFHYANLSISPFTWSSLFPILSQYVPMVNSCNDAGTKGFCNKT